MDQTGENSKTNFYGSISAVNSFSCTANSMTTTANSSTDNKYSKMKKVVGIIETYFKTQAEDLEITINQLLQALSQTTDLSIFDPHTNIASKFFIYTYDLMNILDPRRLTNWYCVDVLLNACKNSSAREEIEKTYHFLPCLARLVSDHITTEKKITLLRLMQELTCGIKIYWQMPHMPHLMTMLCKWIGRQEQDSSDIVTLSLGVLVNLCYKNAASMYVLQKSIDVKKFIRMCLALKGPLVEVYVCQATIIMENIPGYVPTTVDIARLIDSTLIAVFETYRKKDCIILKQIIEFLMEYVKDNSSHLSGYDNGEKNIGQILDIIQSEESTVHNECLSVLLEFISFLIQKRIPQISSLYNRIIPLAQECLNNHAVSYQALVILQSIASTTDKTDNHIWESISVGLKLYLDMLNSCSDSISMTTENVKRLAALLKLLTVSLQIKSLSSKICKELREETFSNIFSGLLADESPKAEVGTCSIESINSYIYALELVSKLVHHNNKWFGLLHNILGNRQIHLIISRAICHSPAEVRTVALELSSSCASGVSAALNNPQSSILMGQISDPVVSSPPFNNFSIQTVGHERVMSLLDSIEHSISKNDINNIAMSELMELYNYKFSYLTQAENAAQLSVDATTKHCTHLQHRIQMLTREQTRLQQSEFHSIQNLENIHRKKTEVDLELRDLQNRFDAEKGRYKVLHSQFLQKEAALKESEEKLAKLQGLFNKLEETGKRLEKNNQKKDEALIAANETNANHCLQIKELDKLLAERNRLLEETRTALQLKSNILDSITKMANSQSLG